MPGRQARPRKWIPLLAAGSLVFGFLLNRQAGWGQLPGPNAEQPARNPTGPTPFPNRSTSCRGCHDQERNRTYSALERAAMICRMTEIQFYDKADKHQIAYTRLANERSRNMIKLLGFKDNDATTVDACLRCHALPEVGGGRMNTAFLSEGVTCVACHGPYREWVGEHPDAVVFLGLREAARSGPEYRPKNWLELTRKEKEELKGMTDLWDPVRRSEICASCHIGNYKEKKVITHAMYAAGHPPLPGFEAATFSEFQPRHWQYLGEKEKSQRDRLRPFDESNLERRLVAISGPIVLRESMRLFAEQARGNRDERSGRSLAGLRAV